MTNEIADLRRSLGAALKSYRLSVGLTQAELAELLGTHKVVISQCERGYLVSCEKILSMMFAVGMGMKDVSKVMAG